MMKMFAKILLIMLAFMLVFSTQSCSNKSYTSVKTDSTVVTSSVVARDTIIKVKADSIELKIPLEELFKKDLKPKKASNSRMSVSVKSDGKNAIIDCRSAELEVIAKLLDTNTKILQKMNTSISDYGSKEDKKDLPWYKSWLMWSGALFWLIVLSVVFRYVYKLFF